MYTRTHRNERVRVHVQPPVSARGSPNLAQLASRLGVSGMLSFRGFKPHHELVAELDAMDVLLFPSLKITETFGIVNIEAMAMGLRSGVWGWARSARHRAGFGT